MKLDKLTKDKIDLWFENITPEELYIISQKYLGQSEQIFCECGNPGVRFSECGFNGCTKCNKIFRV